PLALRPHPRSPLFPYTTLFRSVLNIPNPHGIFCEALPHSLRLAAGALFIGAGQHDQEFLAAVPADGVVGTNGNLHQARKFLEHEDRKSTRLNSSHVSISYAVFC